MATMKSKTTQKLLPAGGSRISWRRFIIIASLTLNLGFIVIWISLASTNSLDGLFMENGLKRYCSSTNDDKFKTATEQVKGLRDYVCDAPAADKYFQEGLKNYFDAANVPYSTKE